MHLSTTLGLGLLVRHTLAVGSVTIINKCSFDVNLWSVSNTQGPQVTLPSGSGTYNQVYETNPNGGGISIKITNEDVISDPITQLEYTLGTGQYSELIWYDLSNINGEPFSQYGVTLTPSDPTCGAVVCTPGDLTCNNSIYLEPDDDYAVKACNVDASLVFTLCTEGQGSAPVTTPEPTTTAAPAPSIPAASSYPLISETFWQTNPALSPATSTPACPSLPAASPEITVTRTTFMTYYTTVDSTVYTTVAGKPKPRRWEKKQSRWWWQD